MPAPPFPEDVAALGLVAAWNRWWGAVEARGGDGVAALRWIDGAALAPGDTVLGAFVHHGTSRAGALCRTAVVAPADPTACRDGARVAIDAVGSLLGWAGLATALGSAVASLTLLEEGSHTAALDAVIGGRAERAAVDPLVFALLARDRFPRLEELDTLSAMPGLSTIDNVDAFISAPPLMIVASGALVPGRALVLPPGSSAVVAGLRAAVMAAGADRDPEVIAAREALRITGFEPLDRSDYAAAQGILARARRTYAGGV